jgi:hypothetical protein
MNPQAFLDLLGSRPSFISVDGSHECDSVVSDLRCAQSLLADGGVVAIDDVLNPRAMGACEGTFRYFLDRSNVTLAPFAYCGNKLFAAKQSDVKEFHHAVWGFAESNPELAISREFTRLLASGRDWVEQKLFGHPVIVL